MSSRAIIVHPAFPLPAKQQNESRSPDCEADWNLLPVEVLPLIASHLDARSLCSLASVNTACRRAPPPPPPPNHNP